MVLIQQEIKGVYPPIIKKVKVNSLDFLQNKEREVYHENLK